VLDGHRPVAFLDMGWEEFKVAAEYDGDQHRSDRTQYVKDIRRHEAVDDLGWYVVRVVSEDRPRDVIDRIDNALGRRGYRRDRR
jgi:very-short-patch-repair endonuclease